MVYVLAAILLVIVLAFAWASGMQSYATAEQARAQIETAQAAQVSAWGNLIVVLVLALLIICVLAFVVWMVLRRTNKASKPRAEGPHETPRLPATPSLETLIQLETLRLLSRMNGSAPSLPASTPTETGGQDDMPWLR